MFRKYMHLKHFGSQEVVGITQGICQVFPKLDGANAVVWIKDSQVCVGNRIHQLGDNEGQKTMRQLYDYIQSHEGLRAYLTKYPNHIVYGEWLVPHSIKTYQDKAWRQFYAFDVWDGEVYLPYLDYADNLLSHDVNVISPLATLHNPDKKTLRELIPQNTWLIGKEHVDKGAYGEGIVIKNYDYRFYREQVFAKMVADIMKVKNKPHTKGKTDFVVEQSIVDKFVTQHLVDKTIAKIENEHGEWQKRFIPQLFGMVMYDLVNEHAWDMVKNHKYPTINFGVLKNLVVQRVKVLASHLFSR